MKNKIFTTATLFLLALGGFISSSFNRFQNVQETIPFSGEYLFEFEVPKFGTQVFTYVFTPKTIVTKMTGLALTTEYSQDVISYDPAEQRCISKGSSKLNRQFIFEPILNLKKFVEQNQKPK